MPPRILKTVTLGCRVNQYETEYVRQGLERLGYREAADGEPVDLCVVNTCAVTAESEAKSRKTIRRLAKLHPRAEIVVLGCYAARAGREAAAMPGVVEVVADKRALPDWLARRGLVDPPAGIDRFPSRRRAYVKIQDGCQNHCSYCIVPKVRPYLLSRPAEDVLDEVRRLIASGHREIVLTGIHLGAYGISDAGASKSDEHCKTAEKLLPPAIANRPATRTDALPDLLRRIAALDGEFRIRFSSIEATEVTPLLLAAMAERRDRVCPQLHVPLQSGSDAVLRRMNRCTTAEQFLERCREIQAALDRPALTTDVIVGFPGETDADFADTCRVVEEIAFAKIHVFRFSPRQGTVAAKMPGQVAQRIAQERAGKLGVLGKKLRAAFLEKWVGRRLRVLVESPAPDHPGWMLGTSDHHAPVALPGGRELRGQFIEAVAGRVENRWIQGIR